MIKSYFGPIKNSVTGASKDIVVNCLSKGNLKNIAIGAAISLAGIIFTGISCFKSGARAYELEEYRTLEELGLISNHASDYCIIDDHGNTLTEANSTITTGT